MSFIKPRSKIECPDKMYKYFGNLQYALISIENDTVHFDTVDSFNDPFECYSELIYIADSKHFGLISFYVLQKQLENDTIKDKSLEDRIKDTWDFQIYNSIISCLKINKEFMGKKAEAFPYEDSKIDLYLFLQSIIKKSSEAPLRVEKKCIIDYFCERWELIDFKEILFEKISKDYTGKIAKQDQAIRVSCFSEKNDSILMWAYYANGYKGICIEYDFTDIENKERMSRILYKPDRTFISNNWFRRKANCWKHEKEWRMVQIPPLEEPRIYVKNVYFGINFNFANEKYYDEIVRCARRKGIGLYRAVQSKVEYGIEFIPLFN